MPPAAPIIAAVAGGVVSSAVGGLIGTSLGSIGFTILGKAISISVGSIVGSLAGGLVSFGINALLSQSSKKGPNRDPVSIVGSGRTQQVREPVAPRRLVYGRLKISGPIIFIHTKDEGGRPNQLLYFVHVLSTRRLSGIDAVLFDNTNANDPKYTNLAKWRWNLGDPNQAAIDMLVEETDGKWTVDHRCRGCAHLATRLRYDESVFRGGVVPNISVIARGHAVYDPRAQTSAYSANAALATADYLTSPYGLGVPFEDIHLPSLIEAAGVCDERVNLKGGGNEPRYEVHTEIRLDEQPGEVLKRLGSAMAGSIVMAGGKWYIHAGHYRPIETVISADDVIGDVTFTANRAWRDLYNGVRANYVRPDAGWQPVGAPVVASPQALLEDAGVEAFADFSFLGTISGTMVQRIAKIQLERNRRQRRYSIPVRHRLIGLRPGSVVYIDLPRQPAGTYKVVDWSLIDNLDGIQLLLEEEAPDIYSWNPATDEQDLPDVPDAEVPDGTVIGTPQLTVTPAAAVTPASVSASWSAVADASGYTLAWRLPGASTWTETSQAGTSATIATGDRASFRVRARRTDGQLGNWDEAPFPANLTSWQVYPTATGFGVTWAGTAKVQVFYGATATLASAMKAATDPTAQNTVIPVASGGLYVWFRPVSPKGVVGAFTAVSFVKTRDTSSPGGGGGIPEGPGGEGGGGGGEGGGDGGGEGGGGDGGF